ncbi:MAG: class I SAM-dependent methyltransferase [Spirochaetia bacterium]|nr:class I SAM-dependent methyltransferase [Spirochaetia bacterium]
MNTQEKNTYQAQLLANRLQKNHKMLKKWARKNRISCYRLYDKDIPEIPLAIDLYTFLPQDVTSKIEAAKFLMEQNSAISENSPLASEYILRQLQHTYILIYLYERPYEKDEAEEELWLKEMALSTGKTLGVDISHILTKTRRHQSDEGKRYQYEKLESSVKITGLTQEQGQLFKINLTDYIDTGLFFDHRPLRKTVRELSKGKSVLNLFCYTGSFSVYAAEGGAKRVESVDMSNTYIEWAKSNMELNGFTDKEKYIFTRQDANGFLNQKNAEKENPEGTNRYDIIILDPPTFSNSKKTEHTLDINRDWPDLVRKCLSILNPKGTLYFSTNSRRLSFNPELLPSDSQGKLQCSWKDITASTIPEDYKNARIHRAWLITKN